VAPGLRDAVQREYDGLARSYDVRWATYNERSLEALRPALTERPLGELLDLGCGTGNLPGKLAAWGVSEHGYSGTDLSFGMLRRAAGKPPLAAHRGWVCADAGVLPFARGSFHTVVAASSFHFWPDPAAVVREIRRVLAPGGHLVLSDWCRRSPVPWLLDRFGPLLQRPPRPVWSTEEIATLLLASRFSLVGVRRVRIRAGWALAVIDAKVDSPQEVAYR
jgi:SAM-dependent methyltransferase